MGSAVEVPERVGEESWEEFCARVDGAVAGYLRGVPARVRYKNWCVMLDTNVVPAGAAAAVVTRMRAPYATRGAFRFKLQRRDLLDALARRLRVHTSETGQTDFDRKFVVRSEDDARVRSLFEDPAIRGLIQSQPAINLEARGGDGPFGASLPEGVDELVLRAPGFLTDAARLRKLFALFALILDRLCAMDSACTDEPGVSL
ncbi:MAG TPA: hypothetical protein VGP08_10030 [Pyrinomonadaceae bacterium]|jgi:hypothetical protein|nr:hypothetical protein [Pyrinomonadaceae bacterium]